MRGLRQISLLLAFWTAVGVSAAAGTQVEVIDLAQQQIGTPPRNFEFGRIGETEAGRWSVVREASAVGGVAIQQAGASRTSPSGLAIYAPLSAVNVKLRVSFKLTDGLMPAAGIAVRVTSPDDYFLVRASAFEARLSLVHVVRGESEEVAGVDADIAQDHWQTLELVAIDDSFRISLDDRWALTAFDHGPHAGGRFALWTEKDTAARFDHVEITPLGPAVGRAGG